MPQADADRNHTDFNANDWRLCGSASRSFSSYGLQAWALAASFLTPIKTILNNMLMIGVSVAVLTFVVSSRLARCRWDFGHSGFRSLVQSCSSLLRVWNRIDRSLVVSINYFFLITSGSFQNIFVINYAATQTPITNIMIVLLTIGVCVAAKINFRN